MRRSVVSFLAIAVLVLLGVGIYTAVDRQDDDDSVAGPAVTTTRPTTTAPPATGSPTTGSPTTTRATTSTASPGATSTTPTTAATTTTVARTTPTTAPLGAMPNTGGPALLPVGVGLVMAGAAARLALRRR